MRARARRLRSAPAAGAGAALALALVLPGVAGASDGGAATASAGAVQATFTWAAAQYGNKDPHLVVTRAGAPAFDGSPVAAGSACAQAGAGCIFAASGKRDAPLQVVDLDADGEPEVLVDAYTGGAHCCAQTEILRFDGAAYATSEASWGNIGYELKDLDGDGRPEFVTADDAFSYAFSSFAGSYHPPLVLDYDPAAKGSFSDVTRRFPALVSKNMKDALHALARARRQHYETLGAVSAYAADLYLLGRGREVHPYLVRARKRGDLRDGSGRNARSFERRLLAFLHKQGYR
jgi:hypothetical protein